MPKTLFVACAIALTGGLAACGESAVTDYQATIINVTDAPFGLVIDDVGTTVSGSFSWNTAVIDSDPLEDSGAYIHTGDGNFRALLPDVEIVGSGFSEVVVANSTTLEITDGTTSPGEGNALLVDGVESQTATLSMALGNQDPVFEDGRLPVAFPDPNPENWAHSFVLSDVNGSLYLQFTELTVVPQ